MLDTTWLPAPGTSSKECKQMCILLKTGKEASNLVFFLHPMLTRGGKANVFYCMPGDSQGTCRKVRAPSTHCQQKPAPLPAVACTRPLLQCARGGGNRPTPCAAFSPRALGRGLWARGSQGAAICGREWRLESRGYVLSI